MSERRTVWVVMAIHKTLKVGAEGDWEQSEILGCDGLLPVFLDEDAAREFAGDKFAVQPFQMERNPDA